MFLSEFKVYEYMNPTLHIKSVKYHTVGNDKINSHPSTSKYLPECLTLNPSHSKTKIK